MRKAANCARRASLGARHMGPQFAALLTMLAQMHLSRRSNALVYRGAHACLLVACFLQLVGADRPAPPRREYCIFVATKSYRVAVLLQPSSSNPHTRRWTPARGASGLVDPPKQYQQPFNDSISSLVVRRASTARPARESRRASGFSAAPPRRHRTVRGLRARAQRCCKALPESVMRCLLGSSRTGWRHTSAHTPS